MKTLSLKTPRKNKALSLFKKEHIAATGDFLLLRPIGKDAIIREAIKDPSLSFEDVRKKLEQGMIQNLFPLLDLNKSGDENLAINLASMTLPNFAVGYVLGLGLIAGLGGGVAFLPAALPAIFYMLGIIPVKGTKIAERFRNVDTPYMKAVIKKIKAGRDKRNRALRARMRQTL